MKQTFFNFDTKIENAAQRALEQAGDNFRRIEEITEYNQQKVLSAFIENRVSESHFTETTGYGYGDRGRETLDRVFADSFGAQDALVRHSFACGTHTLGVALFGLLRPGDTMLSVTGQPYDTIHPVIGITGDGMGSLKDFGVRYEQVELDENGKVLGVTGNTCKRGAEYAENECTNPMRTVTSTMRCSDGTVIPVKTVTPIPKADIYECMNLINKFRCRHLSG